MKLYGYWRSSATWRVRIALALKGLTAEYVPVNLLAGAQTEPGYTAINPQNLVPSLETDDGDLLTQSLAIIRYLDRAYPDQPLTPLDPAKAAQVEAVAMTIACEAQPFGNLRVLTMLRDDHGFSKTDIANWINRWPVKALHAAQQLIARHQPGVNSMFSFGDTPGLAEAFLIPQLAPVRRFGGDLSGLDRLLAVEAACTAHPAFIDAHPDNQPDHPDREDPS
ncbi:MAG: maleylacetoacetate isomerase [Pseudomonadota bacterium]